MIRFGVLFILSFLAAAVWFHGGVTGLLADTAVYEIQPASLATAALEPSTSSPPVALTDLSIDEKIGQLFIVGHWREANYYHVSNLIKAYHLGGVILMGMDAAYIPEVPEWIAAWQQDSTLPLMIATDQEGGVVSRFRTSDFNTTAQPDITDSAEALTIARERGQELHALGINTNFAPVLERSVDPFAFLYDRTFRDPTKIARLGQAMIVGMAEAGVVAVPKHFPGHEDTPIDSHRELPILTVSTSTLAEHIADFKTVIETTKPKALMTAHVLLPEIDPTYPATLSPLIITDILRTEIGFTGVVITDDLGMSAITNDYEPAEAALIAFEAGADMFLFAAQPNDVIPAITLFKEALATGRITEAELDERVGRILQMKASYHQE